jgi:hypothetical protein
MAGTRRPFEQAGEFCIPADAFDGDPPAQALVVGEEDLSHAASPEALLDSIDADAVRLDRLS